MACVLYYCRRCDQYQKWAACCKYCGHEELGREWDEEGDHEGGEA